MKLKLSLVGLMAVGMLVGCGGGGDSFTNGSSSSGQKIVDISETSFIDGIEANTNNVYKFTPNGYGMRFKSLTIADSANKECKFNVLKSKLDWANENDIANSFSQVFTVTSQDYDTKLRPIKGVYILKSNGENINFSIYFMSGGKPENFVEFTLDCLAK